MSVRYRSQFEEALATVYTVRIVTTHHGGETTYVDFSFANQHTAIDTAEDMQLAFDADCDPKRAYVLGEDMVPTRAAGAPFIWSSRRG